MSDSFIDGIDVGVFIREYTQEIHVFTFFSSCSCRPSDLDMTHGFIYLYILLSGHVCHISQRFLFHQ